MFIFKLFLIKVVIKVCAVGFEPNKNLAPGLKDLEKSYSKCGWRTIIYTQTGVDVVAGKAQVGSEFTFVAFYNIKKQFLETNDRSQRVGHIDLKLEDDSYSLLENETVTKTYEVDIIRISDYIKDVVANREIPTGDKGSVVMKLDVEV